MYSTAGWLAGSRARAGVKDVERGFLAFVLHADEEDVRSRPKDDSRHVHPNRRTSLVVWMRSQGVLFEYALFYPVQYEGEESSFNVFYTGAGPEQQAIPASST